MCIICTVHHLYFLFQVEHFCNDDKQLDHDVNLPTKHNEKCFGRSTWDVISGNDDFEEVEPGSFTQIPETKFTILKSGLGRFVMVLDRSGSMDGPSGVPPVSKRINRLKQTAIHWVRLDVQEGSLVGVTSFGYIHTVHNETVHCAIC